MSAVIVRFAKRKAAWETPDITEIRNVEFRTRDGEYDLRPSVYEVEEEQVVQTFAEHAAAAPIEPPGSALGIDFSGVRFKLEVQPGNDKFAFTCACHREFVLATIADLDEIITFACRDLTKRRREIAKDSVTNYVTARLEADDEEWTELLDPPTSKWLQRLAAKRKAATK